MYDGMLRWLWLIEWERTDKDTLLRPAVDGVSLPGSTHLHGSAPGVGMMTYGGDSPRIGFPRSHHFWACLLAEGNSSKDHRVHTQGPVIREHVGLAEAPPRVQQWVWDIGSLKGWTAGRNPPAPRRPN